MLKRIIGRLRSAQPPGEGPSTSTGLEVTESSYMGAPFFVLQGELDQGEARRLVEVIRSRLTTKHARVLLGLSGLEYVGSGGLYLFIDLATELEGRGWLGVINPNGNLRRTFGIVGLDHIESFRIFETSEDAFKAIRASVLPK